MMSKAKLAWYRVVPHVATSGMGFCRRSIHFWWLWNAHFRRRR
jgi:hypothetical protein